MNRTYIEAVGRYLDGCHAEIRIGNLQSNAVLVKKDRKNQEDTGNPVAWPARTKEVMVSMTGDEYGITIIGEGWTAISYPCDTWRVYFDEHHSEPDSSRYPYYCDFDLQNKVSTGWSDESYN